MAKGMGDNAMKLVESMSNPNLSSAERHASTMNALIAIKKTDAVRDALRKVLKLIDEERVIMRNGLKYSSYMCETDKLTTKIQAMIDKLLTDSG